MAKGKGDLDLMVALGMPDKPKQPGEKKSKGLLAGKPARLVAFLQDAVDPSLNNDERAEALCQAIQFDGADEEEAEEPEESLEEDSDAGLHGDDY